jgi:seryl-tRNA synthetase
MLEGKPTTERSGVSEDDALRQAREELAQLEAQRVQLSEDVMEGRPGALEEDERLRARIADLGHWLSEAEKEGGQEGGGTA